MKDSMMIIYWIKTISVLLVMTTIVISCDKNASGTINQLDSEKERPNVVFILADDMGYGDVGFNGATEVSTPNMDRIANEGMVFENAYSPSSVCSPSRYALLTGRYAWRTWNGNNTIWSSDPMLIDTNRLTLPKVLKNVGYKTALIGKWHLGFGAPNGQNWDNVKGPDYNKELAPGPLEAGFDYFYGIPHVLQKPHIYFENHNVLGLDVDPPMEIDLDDRWKSRISYLQRIGVPNHQFIGNESARYKHEDVAINLTDRAVEYIEKQGEKPFFLYFAHRNVHAPLIPNERFKGTSEIGEYGDFLNELDWSVGQILDALERKGLSENTIVFLASDNGGVKDYKNSKIIEYNGHKPNKPFFGQKTEVFEGGIHIPFAVKWPGKIKPNTKSSQIIALTDVIETVAELTNQTLPWNSAEDSFSFMGELLGTESEKPVRQTVIVDGTSGLYGVRKDDWKFINGQGGGGIRWDKKANIKIHPHEWVFEENLNNPPGQLYNLKDDPGETNNLYYENPEIMIELKSILREVQYGGRSR